MNILFYLTRYPGMGGIETVTSQMIEQFTLKEGHAIDVISHWQQEQSGGGYMLAAFTTCLTASNGRRKRISHMHAMS